MQRRKDAMNETNKIMTIEWPFWTCKAMLPNSLGNDMFVWLYLSLLVHLNMLNHRENPYSFSDKAKQDTRSLLKTKFPKIMDDFLLTEIENKIEKDFCDVANQKFGNLVLRKDVESFLDTFESLFSNSTESKTIYKDAITGAICPFFEDLEKDYHPDQEIDYKFDESILRSKEPSLRLVQKAIRESQSLLSMDDPLKSIEAKEAVIWNLEAEEDEEVFEDDTIDFDFDEEEEKNAEPETYAEVEKTKHKKAVKIIEDSYQKELLSVNVYLNSNDELTVDTPTEFPYSKGLTAWFNMLFKRAMIANEKLRKEVNAFFELDKKEEEERADSDSLLELFTSDKMLDKCQDLYDVVSHSKTFQREMRLEVIRINDNFNSISGYFHVGRLLDYLGKTIPDNIDRSSTTIEQYRILMDSACKFLKLPEGAAYKLKSPQIHAEYSRKNKVSDKLAFKVLFANAILNNLACGHSEFLYPEVVDDAWYLYDQRSKVDHPNEHVVLKIEDIQRLTKLARFIVSIQGGEML